MEVGYQTSAVSQQKTISKPEYLRPYRPIPTDWQKFLYRNSTNKFSLFQLGTSANSESTDLVLELPVNLRSYRGNVGTAEGNYADKLRNNNIHHTKWA